MRDAHAARLARGTRGRSACPCGPINQLDEVFADPQVVARGNAHGPAASRSPAPCRRSAPPIRIVGYAAGAERAPPLLGEHTAQVLRERLRLADGRDRALAAPRDGMRAMDPMNGPRPTARVLDRLRSGVRDSRCARDRVAALPAGDSARQSRHHDVARRRRSRRRESSPRSTSSRPRMRARAVVFSARRRRRRTTSSSKAAARRRSRAGRGQHLRAVLVGSAAVQARRDRRGHDALPARRRAQRLRAPRAGDLRARRGDEGAVRRGGARARRRSARTPTGTSTSRPTRCSSSRSRCARRARRPQLRLRARGALGEARIRLRLGVAGDELIEIAPYVHVPESFERRFREMRSANDTIAGVAGLGRRALRLGGCMLGVLWLLRGALARCAAARLSRASSSAH